MFRKTSNSKCFKYQNYFFFATFVVALNQIECNMHKCKLLHNELTTCAGAVMDNYGNLVIEPLH